MNPPKWRLAVLSLCAPVALLVALAHRTISGAQTTPAPKQQSPSAANTCMQLLGRYSGVLPCADYPGITTVLSLIAKSPTDRTHTHYVLKRTYQDRANTQTETGTWTILRGTPDDPNATVYQLTPTNGGQPTNFLKVSDNELLQLNNDRRRIDSNLNFSLKKTTPKPSPNPTPKLS